MKKYVFLSVVGLVLFGLAGPAWAQCPEQPNDNGICDTVYVECYDPFNYTPPPWQVRFPIMITNDIPNPATDSIAGMLIPLTFTSSNPTAQAEIEYAHHNANLYPSADLNNSVFRHLPSMDDPQIRNWMMDFSEQEMGLEWNTRFVIIYPDGIDITVVPTGPQDQNFPGGSRLLHATITFTLEDTTTICVDTCFYQPSERLAFSRSDAVLYIPRHNMPYCISIEQSEHGDATGDGVINIADVIYMINYLYKSGPYPASFEAGDANCDDDHGILDVLILVNYLYKGGRPPGCI